MAQTRIYVFIALVVLSFSGLGILWSHINTAALTYFTKEDGFLEWLTFLIFLSTSLFCFFNLYIQVSTHQLYIKSLRFWGIFALGSLIFIGAGEEISWAQRLFDFNSPDFFQNNNNQSETNLHNLNLNGVKVNKLIFGKILFLCVLLHNVILPLVATKKKQLKVWMEKIGGFFPPWPLVVIYIVAGTLVEFVEHERYKELLETAGALHYSSSIFLTYALGVNYTRPLIKSDSAKAIAASALIVFFVFLMINALILSSALEL